jgi:two-component system LytT family response regulator
VAAWVDAESVEVGRRWISVAALTALGAAGYCAVCDLIGPGPWRPALSVLWGLLIGVAVVGTIAMVTRALGPGANSQHWLGAGAAVIAGTTVLVLGERVLGWWYWNRSFDQLAVAWWQRLPLLAAVIPAVALWQRLPRHEHQAPGPALAPPPDHLEVPTRGGIRRIDIAEISHLRAAANYVELHGAFGKALVRASLGALAEQLAGAGFVRIHRSAAVRLAAVRRFRRDRFGSPILELSDGTTLRIGRAYVAEAVAALERSPLVPHHGR